MKMNAALLSHLISERYPVTRFGKGLAAKELPLPVFYESGTATAPGQVYVARTQDLPQTSSTDCLFICVGNRPSHIHRSWVGDVLYVEEYPPDLLALFNFVIGLFSRVMDWHDAMRRLLQENAGVEEFVSASLPLFENGITITDYDLRLLVNCDLEEINGTRRIIIVRDLDRIPYEVSANFLNSFSEYAKRREPFLYKGQRENPEGDNYCINLYLGDTYLGSCALWEKLRPMRESDFILFQQFAAYIQQALSVQSRLPASELVTIKSILADLLQCFPVSKEELSRSEELLQRNMALQNIRFGCWRCIVIRSANRGKTLPSQYLCATIEDMIPHSFALVHDDSLACFCMIPEGESCEDTVCDILAPYLRDMNFRAGISEPFLNILKAYDYFRQASAILSTGFQLTPAQYMYRFADYALPYMLHHCLGEFEPDMLLSHGLRSLQSMGTGVDYMETLRHFLDNECNASRTAQELYLHRSSLLPRLERMKTLVDLDTPEQRLYLRMCLYLQDYIERAKKQM